MRSVHQPQIVELRGGRWMVECLACRSDHLSEVPIGIGLALPDRLTAERLAENHARDPSHPSRPRASLLVNPVVGPSSCRAGADEARRARSWRRGPAPARRRRGSPGPSCSSWSHWPRRLRTADHGEHPAGWGTRQSQGASFAVGAEVLL